MANLAYLCNTAWMSACGREARRFATATKNVARTQNELLLALIRANCDTQFGRQHGFTSIRDIRDFQNAVPLSTYDDYRPAINRIANGDRQILTVDPVRSFLPTGGSTCGNKLIPYTASLSRSFQRAISTWIWDLFWNRPAVRHGRAYWSVSPLAQANRKSAGGIPIGFENDTDYLGWLERRFAAGTLAVPGEIAQCQSIESARYVTLFYLLRAADLSLISMWSPTFLSELIRSMIANWEQLLDDIERGRISAEYTAGCALFQREYRPLRERAGYLRSIHVGKSSGNGLIPMIWPSLALVSCWADGPSTWYADQLRKDLDNIEIQGKGLLATEAFVSIPRVAQPAPALAVRSHFFEFQPVTTEGASGHVVLANELEPGRDYHVIVSTAGGLYRYQMHDQVTVVGFEMQAPLLRFVGRSDATSDLVGEKLSDAHVRHTLQSVFQKYNIHPNFAVLKAERGPFPHYTLYLFAPSLIDNSTMIDVLRTEIESGLSANPCYQYARQATQLGNLRLKLVNEQRASVFLREYTADCLAAGQRLGDVKPHSLISSR